MPIERLTVRQLIDLLGQFPEDWPVVVQSYEDGYDPVTAVAPLTVTETPARPWWVGVYHAADKEGEPALLLSSKYSRTDEYDAQ